MNGMLTKVVAVVAMVAAAGLAQAGGAARVAKRSRGGRLRMTAVIRMRTSGSRWTTRTRSAT